MSDEEKDLLEKAAPYLAMKARVDGFDRALSNFSKPATTGSSAGFVLLIAFFVIPPCCEFFKQVKESSPERIQEQIERNKENEARAQQYIKDHESITRKTVYAKLDSDVTLFLDNGKLIRPYIALKEGTSVVIVNWEKDGSVRIQIPSLAPAYRKLTGTVAERNLIVDQSMKEKKQSKKSTKRKSPPPSLEKSDQSSQKDMESNDPLVRGLQRENRLYTRHYSATQDPR